MTAKPRSILVWLPLLLAACSDGMLPLDHPDGGNDDATGAGADGGALPDGSSRHIFRNCTAAPAPSGLATESWARPLLSELIALDTADHSAQDVLAASDKATAIGGKFAYGPLSKDLEGEWVEVWIDDCSGSYRLLGRSQTDSDGRIQLPLAVDELPVVGLYQLHLRVVGDNSSTRAQLRVLPPGTQLVVFDIDGTLTTDDLELFKDLLGDLYRPIAKGDYLPKARDQAVEISQLRAQQGYALVYLTGRPYQLTAASRSWLEQLGFAPGNLHTTDDVKDILPAESAVGAFKAGYLTRLQALGFTIAAAYGNATTDIYAYAEAGIDKQQTFILGKHGAGSGAVALGDDYVSHLAQISGEAPANQPLDWPKTP